VATLPDSSSRDHQLQMSDPESWLTPNTDSARRRPGFVGRDLELAALETDVERAAGGEAGCVLILGEPGVGKTRLANELLRRHASDTIALRARAHDLGATSPFGLWSEALEGRLRTLEPARISELSGGYLADLSALLRSAAAISGPPSGEPPRARLLEAVAVLVANLAADLPVVALLDDVQMADASSLDALHYLLRNLPHSRLLILATARPADLAAQSGPRQMLLGLEQDGLLRRVNLSLLSGRDLGALAQVILGEPPPPSLVSWLAQHSRGNPLFALGLLQALVEEKADLSAPGLQRVPEALAERVAGRVELLDEPSRAVLEVIAIVGRRVDLGALVGLTGRPLDRLGPLLDRLVPTGLVTVEERGREITYEIDHPLIQEIIYQNVGPARRRALHRLVGRALLATGQLGEAAPHLVRSADVGDPEAIEALCQAIRQAEERQAYREALTILGALVDLIPPGDERWLAALDAMVLHAEWVVDHRADVHAALAIPALRAIDALLPPDSDPARRATVKFRLASFLTWGMGQYEEGERAAREARRLYEVAGDQRGALLASLEEAMARVYGGDTKAWLSAPLAVAEAAEAAGDQFVLMQALGRPIGWANFYRGRFAAAAAAFERAATLAEQQDDPFVQSTSLAGLGFTYATMGRTAEALRLMEQAKATNPGWREETQIGEWEIMVHWLAGNYPTAIERARESLVRNATGTIHSRAWGALFAAFAAPDSGQPAEARWFLTLARGAQGARSALYREVCSWAEAVIDGRTGRQAEAASSLEATTARLLELEARPFAAFALVDLAELVADLSPGRAVVVADTLDEVARELDSDLYRGLAATASAQAALARDDREQAAAAAELAVAHLTPLGCRAFLGEAQEILGRSFTPLDRDRARQALEAAAKTFQACGAIVLQDRALAALRSLGGGGRRAASSVSPAALTPREREVAALAAAGRSAREISQALFIGKRTVESHLTHIYAKLGLSSQLDLVKRAAELGLEEPPP
jgi:DNA-binding CsgD family transcriptional regulator